MFGEYDRRTTISSILEFHIVKIDGIGELCMSSTWTLMSILSFKEATFVQNLDFMPTFMNNTKFVKFYLLL